MESTTARDQSISPRTPRRCRNCWCSRSQSPALVHSVNRRCAVARLTPNSPADSFHHEHPACTRYTIAASTARSSARRLPPPCRRGGGTGINGCAACQKSSGAQVRTMSSITKPRSCPRSPTVPLRHALSRAVVVSTEPDGAATYQRMTVFLTPEQRRWIKDTGRGLSVDGLSASDLVWLAVTQLHQQVDAGLPLLEALTAQAHQEAACHPGRKHRGLPPAL